MGTCTFTGNHQLSGHRAVAPLQINQNPREKDNLGYHWDQKWRQETRGKTQPMTVLCTSSHMIQDYQTIFPKWHKNPVKQGKVLHFRLRHTSYSFIFKAELWNYFSWSKLCNSGPFGNTVFTHSSSENEETAHIKKTKRYQSDTNLSASEGAMP